MKRDIDPSLIKSQNLENCNQISLGGIRISSSGNNKRCTCQTNMVQTNKQKQIIAPGQSRSVFTLLFLSSMHFLNGECRVKIAKQKLQMSHPKACRGLTALDRLEPGQ